MNELSRRAFLKDLGLSASALSFLYGLPSLQAQGDSSPKKRLIIMFSPNGTLPGQFWPDASGEDFILKPIMEPLAPYKDSLLTLKGVHNKVGGDGDDHMKGISLSLIHI